MKRQPVVATPVEVIDSQTRQLDLVVPFTTPQLTRIALKEAERLSTGLNAAIRVVKVQVVPYPLPIDQSPVYIGFLREQMENLRSDLDLQADVRLARDFEPALESALNRDSVVVLASPGRPWPTRTERLAKNLRAKGYTVCLT
jgi:hypothetical protein